MDEMSTLPSFEGAHVGYSSSTTQHGEPTMNSAQFVAQSQARLGSSSVTMNEFRRAGSMSGSDLDVKPATVLSATEFRPAESLEHRSHPVPAFVNYDEPQRDMRGRFDMFRDGNVPSALGDTLLMDMMPFPREKTGIETTSMENEAASTLRTVTFDEEASCKPAMAGQGKSFDRMQNLHFQMNVTPSPQAEMSPWLEEKLLSHAPRLPPRPKIIYKVEGNMASEITKHKHWTEEEDAQLKLAVANETPEGGKHDWRAIARLYFGNTRSATQCKVRWKNHLKPGILRGNWQEHEDQIILHMVSQGKKWAEISSRLPGRIGENVRERYVNVLDPRLLKTPWTEEEDRILFEAHSKSGNKWSEIRKLIPGRSENNIKNRYHNRKNAHRRKMKREAEERLALAEGRAYWECPHAV
jgi:hypothetical protein